MSFARTGLKGLTLLLSLSGLDAHLPETGLKIEIHIRNYSAVSGETLARAEQETMRIFERAGVGTIWRDCPLTSQEAVSNRACALPDATTRLTLRLLTDSMADALHNLRVPEVNDLEIHALTTEFKLAAHSPSPWQRDPETPSITVRTYNLANAPTRDLVQANHATEQVFKQAGIEIRWLSCALSLQEARTNRACEEAIGRHDLDVVVSTASITRPGIATDASLGFAFPLARRSQAVVLWERSKNMAESSGVPAAIILGHAMAHELGHLLLHSTEHFRSGIMRSRWRKEELLRAERGSLLFTTAQATAMRNGLVK